MEYYGKTGQTTAKANRDILLKADLASEKYVISELRTIFPQIPVVSEENSVGLSGSKHRFVLDPLDGTINFSRSIDQFGISLAFQENKETQMAVVYKPALKELYIAEKKKGAYLNDKKIQVSSTGKMEEAIIAFDGAREEDILPNYVNVLHSKVRVLRSYGCAVQTLGYVATGKNDAYVFTQPKIWDIAAMQIVIEEAGGRVVDFNGNTWKENQPLLVSNDHLLQPLIKVINKLPQLSSRTQ